MDSDKQRDTRGGKVDYPHGGWFAPLYPVAISVATAVVVWLLLQELPRSTYSLLTPNIIATIVAISGVVSGIIFFGILRPFLRMRNQTAEMIEYAYKSGERWELVIHGSGVGFWDYDVSNGTFFFSQEYMSLLGYAQRDFTGNVEQWYELMHPDDADGVKRTVASHLDHRTPTYTIEYRIRRSSGEYMWVEDRGKASWDTKGRATRLVGVTNDISNMKRVQEVLEGRTNELESAKNAIEEEIQNVKKFQKAVDASTEAVVITDPLGAVIYVNPAWSKLNGYTDTEALGRNLRILKSEHTDPRVFQEMWEKISSGLPYVTEDMINRRKNGSEYHAAVSVFPVREGAQTLFYVAICQDITQRKEVDRAKTEFVSLASHQLRTPLSAIRWYSEMLLSKYVGTLNEKQQQYLHEIYQGNLRMVDLVNALLNVSRIDLGTFAIEPENVNLVEICDSVIGELTPQMKAKHQSIARKYSSAPSVYLGDPKLLRIIFQNFLSNSVKYTQESGSIEVEIATREQNIYIRVTDNGYGIPKQQHGKMFEKLFRADNVRQKDTEGTGLGMYIVKAIIESSGGRIWFESDENKGTTFHVVLPITGMPRKTGTKDLA